MLKPHSLSRALLITTFVALGIAVFWTTIVSWVEQTAAQALQKHPPYETIYTTIEGEPVLVRTTSGGIQETEKILSLSGEALKITSQDLLHLNALESQQPVRSYPASSDWQARIAGINDGGVPATYWYLVHDGRYSGHVYGIGFHASTRTVSGYFGRSGFSNVPPPREDWFEIPGTNSLYGMLTVFNFGQEPRWTYGKPHFLLLADGKLRRIDLAKKQIIELLDCPQAFRLGQIYRIPAERPVLNDDSASISASAITPLDGVVREPESLVVINQQSGEQKRFSLPPVVRDKTLSVTLLPSGQLLLLAQRDWRDNDPTIMWLDASGEITKQQSVHLQPRYQSPSWAWTGWQYALAAPLPLASAVYALVIGPFSVMEQDEADNYSQGVALILRHTFPSLLAILVLGIVAAVGAYRRQRRFGLPNAGVWAAFAFVLGLPGWLAYRYHRTWPVLEECPACRQPAPRDRESCLDCGTAFPPPPLKGIEVFA
jgi:hypothetical protein